MANSKNKSKTGLIGKIRGLSKRGQIIMSVAAFAIIGGGIFVYKSFAYDPGYNSVTFSVANGWLQPYIIYNFEKNQNKTTTPTKINDPGKNNVTVYDVAPGASVLAQSYPNGLWIPEDYYYDICVLASKNTKSKDILLTYQQVNSNGSKYPTTLRIAKATKVGNYVELCTGVLNNRAIGWGSGYGPIKVYNWEGKSNIRISSVTVKLGQRLFK